MKSLYGIWILSHVPVVLGQDLGKHEYICQLEGHDGSHGILFFNLKSYAYKILTIPYIIHSIIPIRDNTEFILTSKGGYLFHCSRDRIISSLKSPKDIMFYGHSSYFESDSKIYASAIQFMDYDNVPTRKAVKKNEKDVNFGQGYLYEISLEQLKIMDRFSTNGLFPHDQRRLNNSEMMVLNSTRGDLPHYGGELALIDRKKKEVIKHHYLDKSYGYGPMAHIFGDEELALVGISEEACVIFFDGNKMRKTVLDSSAQKAYGLGEMLNATFNSDGSRVLAMNVDNQFLGLWDCKTGKLLKHCFMKGIISVNRYEDFFLVSIGDGLKFFDFDLNLKKEVYYQNLSIFNKWNCGPHTVII